MSLKRVQKILQEPVKTPTIRRAEALEESVRFHTEVSLSEQHVARASASFLAWVAKLLPEDKFEVFKQLFTFPISTTSVIEDIYFELSRVFDSRNASNTYQFKDTEQKQDWLNYRLDYLEADTIWKITGWDKMRTSFNSILVVDLPATQEGSRPEPYFYWLDINKVIDYELDHDGSRFKWVLFKQDDGKLALFDELSIQLYQCTDDYTEVLHQISDSPHKLGFCPARFFWTDTVNSKEPDLRKNPIVKELANLDWLLFFSIGKRHLDLYAPYPIYSMYEASCDYKDSATDAYCDHGYMRLSNGVYSTLRDGSVEQCPICKNKQVVGPGTLLEVPTPDKDTADMRNPVQITTIDEASLKYNTKETTRLEALIKARIVGQDSETEASGREAVNELQVRANFESKTSVLSRLKANFELAQAFVEETICKLRYGSGFIELSINYGSEFYVYTLKELYDKYELAKKIGAMSIELDLLQNQILEMEHKNNSQTLQRIMLLKQIEPFRHSTLDEVIKLQNVGVATTVDLIVKVNFDAFVDRFERENSNVLDFGIGGASMNDKVIKIKNRIYDYAREQQQEQQKDYREQGQDSRGENG